MIKRVIVFLFIFCLLSCEPVQHAQKKKTSSHKPVYSCLTSQSACEVNTEFGRFTLLFSGKESKGKLKTELPFQLQLRFEPISDKYQVANTGGYLEGKTMFMGKIPVFFEQGNTNIWLAQTLLASCSEEVMTWQLWIQVEILAHDKKHQQEFFIDFDSVRL